MSWAIAIALALGAFAASAFAMRVPRGGWAAMAAALALGLAGYATQASPGLRGTPAKAVAEGDEQGWSLVDARSGMVDPRARSTNDKVLVADAFARRGKYREAAALLNAATAENPRDADAWLALGNALVEHADGALTTPAMLAYRRAGAAAPNSVGPGYFLGLALIRQGRLGEARVVWAGTLESAPAGAAGRDLLVMQLGRLDGLLASGGRIPIPEQE